MRTMVMSILAVIAAIALAACTVIMDEGSEPYIDQTYETDEQAMSLSSDGPVTEAAKDCSVSIQCANGTTRSCNGTSGSCSANGVGTAALPVTGPHRPVRPPRAAAMASAIPRAASIPTAFAP